MTPGALGAQVKMSFQNLNFCLSMLDIKTPTRPLQLQRQQNPVVQAGKSSQMEQSPRTHPCCSIPCPGAPLDASPVSYNPKPKFTQCLEHWVYKKSIKKKALTSPVSQPSWLELLLYITFNINHCPPNACEIQDISDSGFTDPAQLGQMFPLSISSCLWCCHC